MFLAFFEIAARGVHQAGERPRGTAHLSALPCVWPLVEYLFTSVFRADGSVHLWPNHGLVRQFGQVVSAGLVVISRMPVRIHLPTRRFRHACRESGGVTTHDVRSSPHDSGGRSPQHLLRCGIRGPMSCSTGERGICHTVVLPCIRRNAVGVSVDVSVLLATRRTMPHATNYHVASRTPAYPYQTSKC